MPHSATVRPPLPIGSINTTPLIDVLLVLLVMLVITIPPATHSLDVDVPQCAADCEFPEPDPVLNRLALDSSDALLWNGTVIDRAGLSALLAASRRLPVEPELQFAPDPAASYDAAAHTLGLIKSSGVTKFGFVGNERFRDFGSIGSDAR